MAYHSHFKLTDDLILHLDKTFGGIGDPFIESRYTGFLAVSSVTVLELALKEIFVDFAEAKNKVFGDFCREYFDRINGRINLKTINDDYLKKFGSKYGKWFKKRLDSMEKRSLKTHKVSITASYGNLLTWRNEFAHEGRVPVNASYNEVKNAYECGKQVMGCLAGCMRL